jgi:hypothetical protein
MKVEKIDIIWSAISMIIVWTTMRRGNLPDGIFLIYLLMAALFGYHIWQKRRSLRNSVAAYGKIVDYHTSQKLRGCFPVVTYTTEDGREVTSVYSVVERKPHYEIGDEEMICYDPDDPMFFYFSGRESELTQDYMRFIIYGAPVALLMLVIR